MYRLDLFHTAGLFDDAVLASDLARRKTCLQVVRQKVGLVVLNSGYKTYNSVQILVLYTHTHTHTHIHSHINTTHTYIYIYIYIYTHIYIYIYIYIYI